MNQIDTEDTTSGAVIDAFNAGSNMEATNLAALGIGVTVAMIFVLGILVLKREIEEIRLNPNRVDAGSFVKTASFAILLITATLIAIGVFYAF